MNDGSSCEQKIQIHVDCSNLAASLRYTGSQTVLRAEVEERGGGRGKVVKLFSGLKWKSEGGGG